MDGQGKTRERTGTCGGGDYLGQVKVLVLWYLTRPSDQILEFIVGQKKARIFCHRPDYWRW